MNEQIPQIQVFQTAQEEHDIRLGDYLTALKRRWRFILLISLVVMSLSAAYAINTQKQYSATAVIKLPTQGGGGLATAFGVFSFGEASDLATEMEIIKGREVAETVIRNLGLDEKEKNIELDWRLLVLRFQRTLKIGQKAKSNLIEITATGDSPAEAKDIANAVVDEYIKLSEATNQKSWNSLINQMEVKLTEAKKEMEESRQLLHEYEAKEGITTAFSPLLMGAGTSKEGYGTQYAVPEIPQAVAELKSRIMQMEIQLEGMRKHLAEENPDVIRLKSQIAESKQKLQQEESKAIEKYNKQFGLTDLAAKVLFNQQLVSTLVAKQEELKAQYIMQNKPPEAVERAQEPLFPSGPNVQLNIMIGWFFGVLLGLGLAILQEYMAGSVHTPEDVKRSIDLPVLGRIPCIKKFKGKAARKIDQTSLLITYVDPRSSRNTWIRELYRGSYRMLQLEVISSIKAGNISEHSDEDKNLHGHTLLVTSSLPKEGKSIVATNLAISIAQTGKRVLLVDTDYRNSSQRLLLNLMRKDSGDVPDPDAGTGLMDTLAGRTAWKDVIRNTYIDNLHVINSGGNNPQQEPSVLFMSSRMEDLIKSSKESFDFVIFDSSPVTLTSEPAAIGSKVDSIVLVIKVDDTKENVVLHAKQIIQSSGGNILGVVLNCMVPEKKYYKRYF